MIYQSRWSIKLIGVITTATLLTFTQVAFGIGLDSVRELPERSLSTETQEVSTVSEYRDYYFQKFDVQLVESSTVETDFPSWATPNPEQDQTDLAYWVNEVLPYPEDRDEDAYIVYPKHGVVVPILTPTSTDIQKIQQGELFDHYGYLEEGALHYFGDNPAEGVGNMVIAAHSSYKKNDPGRYKTVFQALPISREGDKIFVYLKNESGAFDFYEYSITRSYETDKYDVSVLKQNVDMPTLTTYGCYVIGSNKDRRINRAILANMEKGQSDLNEPVFIAKNDTPELVHGSAETNTVSPTINLDGQDTEEEEKDGSIATSLSTKLAFHDDPITPVEPPTFSTQQVRLEPIEPKVVEPVEEPEPTYGIEIPLAFQIKYLPEVKKISYRLFQATLRGGVRMPEVIGLIEQLQEKYEDEEAKQYLLAMLIGELRDY